MNQMDCTNSYRPHKTRILAVILLFISASFATMLPTVSADDDFSSATLLQSGVMVEGIVNDPAGTDSHDYYRIDVSIGDSIVFELGSDDYANFCIFEGTSNDIACYGWVESVVKHYVHAQNDTYYVEATCEECEWGGVSGEYNITATVYSDEAGDSMNESTHLEPNTLVSGTAIGTDTDFFHTPVVNGDTIHVVIDSDDGHMTSYSIYDENEIEIQNDSELGDYDFNVSITDSGNLTIELTCAFEEQCNYSLIASGSSYVPDTDGDGVTDDLDQCEGHDDNIDVDSDGIPDGCDPLLDNDGDGIANNVDEFPDDVNESVDSDDDGVGDNADAFPNDANETSDADLDGVGDNADAFPNNANETTDSDGDGVGDNSDACEGHDDNIDVDEDNLPDGCDDEIDDTELPICGDGIIQAGEVCDDGNINDGDGCDASCSFDDSGPESNNEADNKDSDDTDDSGYNLFMIPLLVIGLIGILLFIPKLKDDKDLRPYMKELEKDQYDETKELKEDIIPRKDKELDEATKVLAVAAMEKDSDCKKAEELARQAKALQENAAKAAMKAAEKEGAHANADKDLKRLIAQKASAENRRDGYARAVEVIINYSDKLRKRGDISGAESVASNVSANADASRLYGSDAIALRKAIEEKQPETEDLQNAAKQAREEADDLQDKADKAIAKAEKAAEKCKGAEELVKKAKGKQQRALSEAKTARKVYAEQAEIANINVEKAEARREAEFEQEKKNEQEQARRELERQKERFNENIAQIEEWRDHLKDNKAKEAADEVNEFLVGLTADVGLGIVESAVEAGGAYVQGTLVNAVAQGALNLTKVGYGLIVSWAGNAAKNAMKAISQKRAAEIITAANDSGDWVVKFKKIGKISAVLLVRNKAAGTTTVWHYTANGDVSAFVVDKTGQVIKEN